MVVLRLFAGIFLGLLLYLGVTILVLGTIMVIREGLLFAFKFDLYEYLKNLVEQIKVKSIKVETKLLEESDEEWLKNRGRY